MNSIFKILASTAVCAGVGIVAATGCSKTTTGDAKADSKEQAAQPAQQPARRPVEAVAVTTAPVSTRSIQRTVEAVGTFYGRDEVVVAPKVTGRVKKVYFDMGDAVRPGELLLEIDDVDFRLAVQEAEKSLEMELAKVGLREPPEADVDLSTLPAIVRARLLTENAANKLKRVEGLLARNVATQEEYEQLKTDYNVATSDYHQADLDARATLATARQKAALLNTARQRLADTKLIAPTSTGVGTQPVTVDKYFVAERMVTEGEMVESTPMTAVFRLVIDDPLKLRVAAPEREVSEIKLGQPVDVVVEAYPGRKFAGKVARISPAVDLASRTFGVEILVPNSKHELKTGNFGKAEIYTHQDTAAIAVPPDSIISFAGVTKVFIVQDGKAQGVEVQTGVRGDGWCEVFGPLQPGMQVVTSGYTKLADGTPVRPRADDTLPVTPATTAPLERLSER